MAAVVEVVTAMDWVVMASLGVVAVVDWMVVAPGSYLGVAPGRDPRKDRVAGGGVQRSATNGDGDFLLP